MASSKIRIAYTDHYAAVMKALTTKGLLLGAYDAAGKPNLMTIGWGAIGHFWGKPVWVTFVRPSRYTYKCIEATGGFTVNVPMPAQDEACRVCGVESGREADKFALCGLTAEQAETVRAPAVVECPLVYECKVVHSNDVISDRLSKEIIDGAYPGGNFHRIYYGEIVVVRAAAGAAKALARK
jgi:flavin reductase (DIM6/NTAB) family NADH-FMN oxidoreductase RutF